MAVRAAMLPNFQRRGLDCPLLFRNLFTYRVREQHPPNYNYRYIYEYEYNFLNPYPNKYFKKQRLFVASYYLYSSFSTPLSPKPFVIV